jgi:kynurenine formamidase
MALPAGEAALAPDACSRNATSMTRSRALAYLFAAAFMLFGCSRAPNSDETPASIVLPEGARLVDLSHSFDDSTIHWPTSKEHFHLEPIAYGPTPAGYFYASYSFCAAEHGGTHLDAPRHFAEHGATTDAIPLERLVAPAVVIDMSDDAAKDRDALLGRSHLESFEAEHGTIAPGTIVLVRTDWSERWPDLERYLGDTTPGDVSNLHFPGIGADAAELLVERQIAAVGLDTASLDHGPSREFEAHRILAAAGIPGFENLHSLAQLPARGALVIALPMKIGQGSGGPLRAIAIVP